MACITEANQKHTGSKPESLGAQTQKPGDPEHTKAVMYVRVCAHAPPHALPRLLSSSVQFDSGCTFVVTDEIAEFENLSTKEAVPTEVNTIIATR